MNDNEKEIVFGRLCKAYNENPKDFVITKHPKDGYDITIRNVGYKFRLVRSGQEYPLGGEVCLYVYIRTGETGFIPYGAKRDGKPTNALKFYDLVWRDYRDKQDEDRNKAYKELYKYLNL